MRGFKGPGYLEVPGAKASRLTMRIAGIPGGLIGARR